MAGASDVQQQGRREDRGAGLRDQVQPGAMSV